MSIKITILYQQITVTEKQGAGPRGHFHGVYFVLSGLLLKFHAPLSPQEAVGDNRTPLLSHSISSISTFY